MPTSERNNGTAVTVLTLMNIAAGNVRVQVSVDISVKLLRGDAVYDFVMVQNAQTFVPVAQVRTAVWSRGLGTMPEKLLASD